VRSQRHRTIRPDYRVTPASDPKAEFHDLGADFYDGRTGTTVPPNLADDHDD
jgi:hypothetical protein